MKSALHDAYSQHNAKTLSKRDYQILNAGWVSQNVHEYRPQYFDSLSARSQAYCDTRISGHRDYDAAEAKALGLWFERTTTVHQENAHNKSLLLWAAEKLQGVGIDQAISKLLEAAKLFDRIRLDNAAYLKAVRTKELDVYARTKARAG